MSVLTKQKRKEKKIEKEHPTIVCKEETLETTEGDVLRKEQQKEFRKLKFPDIIFEHIEETPEVAHLFFVIKFHKKKIKLLNVRYEKIETKNEVPTIQYKIQKRKMYLKLSSVKFEKIGINNEVEILKWRRKSKKIIFCLPNVDFQKINLKGEVSPIIFRSVQRRVSEMSRDEYKMLKYGEGSYGASFGEDLRYYEEDEELHKFGALLEILGRDPVIIILVDEEGISKEFLKDILKRLVEEYEGEFRGFEEITITTREDYTYSKEGETQEERKEEIRRFLSVNKKVVIINSENLRNILEKIDNVSLADRLNEMKGGGLGFLVFNIRKYYNGDIQYLRNLMTAKSIACYKISVNPDNVIHGIKTIFNISSSYDWHKLSETIKKEDETLREGRDCYEVIRKFIISKQKEIIKNLSLVVKRNEGKESDLHYSLKCLTVLHIAKEIKKIVGEKIRIEDLLRIEKEIKTEEKIEVEGKTNIADVYCDGEVWEIETLLGEGERGGVPIKKIDETIRKWEDISQINKINIIIDNITWFLHKRQIIPLIKLWKRKLGIREREIHVWIPDWIKKKLRKVF